MDDSSRTLEKIYALYMQNDCGQSPDFSCPSFREIHKNYKAPTVFQNKEAWRKLKKRRLPPILAKIIVEMEDLMQNVDKNDAYSMCKLLDKINLLLRENPALCSVKPFSRLHVYRHTLHTRIKVIEFRDKF